MRDTRLNGQVVKECGYHIATPGAMKANRSPYSPLL